ncbi:MAG TPA: hypothetical protein VGL93_02990 [Streptosporangiaceae bacterium]|jgi:hypothetical protein
MSERRGLDLSFSQLAAGALATVTATVLASFFGAYGTIIGAAASSVVSTAGAAIYQHFFRRTGDKLKEAGQHMSAVGLRSTLVSERGAAVGTQMSTVRVPGPEAPKPPESPERPPRPRTESKPRARTLADVVDNTGTATSRVHGFDAEPGRTAGAFGAVSGNGTESAAPGATDDGGADDGTDDGDDGDATRVDGAARQPGESGETTVLGAAGTTNLAGSDDAETMAISAMTGVSEVYSAKSANARPTLGAMLTWARGRWVVLLGGAVLVFVVVMGGVTLAEKVMNKPLSDAVRGKSGTGTSLFQGSGGRPTDTPTGTPGSTTSPGPTDSTGPNPGQTAQSTPNPGQTAQRPPARNSQAPPATGAPTQNPTPQPTTTGGGATNGPNGNNAQREGQPTTPSGQ